LLSGVVWVRGYIFTRAEEECLVGWLEGGEETPLVRVTLSRLRRAERLMVHVELMALALRRIQAEGRLLGVLRLRRGSGSGVS
jgi:hypothetical protein